MDRDVHLPTCSTDRSPTVPGSGGQLPSSEPHRGSDGGHLGDDEDWGYDVLRSAGRPEGEKTCRITTHPYVIGTIAGC